jgi:hypothetical protein
MVGYAYDLGPRQSARIIEQSARQRATVWAETIEQSQPRAFNGCLLYSTAETIVLQLNPPGPDSVAPVPGQYYQILISLGDSRYLTVCDLLEIQPPPNQGFLVFSRPKSLQVLQRRHHHRQLSGPAFPVYISWQTGDELEKAPHTPALGQVRDLSLYGLSARVPENLNNHLFIGDTVYLRFSLNVREPEYFTSATLCHKELIKNSPELIIGLQFSPAEENGDFSKRLQAALTPEALTKDSKDTNKGI